MAPRADLSSLLVAHDVATTREIERALAAVGRPGQPLWAALMAAGLVSAMRLFELLRDHSKIPLASEDSLRSTPALEQLNALLSREDALVHGILLLDRSPDGKRVQLAMVDPTDQATLRPLAAAAGVSSAKVHLVEHSRFVAAVERAYARRAAEPAERATVEPAAKVGRRSELEAAERLEHVLVQAALSIGGALEAELLRGGGSSTFPREAARLAREVARELGHERRQVTLAGLAAMMVQLDALRRARTGVDEPTLFDELGWAAGGDDGLLGVARALTAPSAGFSRPPQVSPTQRIVHAVSDYLALASAEADGDTGSRDGHVDAVTRLDATEQLLRTSSAGAQVVDALLRVLRRDLAEQTPALATRLPESREEPSGLTNVRPVRARRRTDPGRPRTGHEERTQLVPMPNPARSNDPSHEG